MDNRFTQEEIGIILDALLHEMQRYNEVLALVSNNKAERAIEAAKNDVYKVFTKVNSFTM